jgi:hypothetical protein
MGGTFNVWLWKWHGLVLHKSKLGVAKERLVMGIHLNKNKCGEQNIHRQGTKGRVFGLGNSLNGFIKP